MDAQKATEVEMKELTSTEVKDSKDAEKMQKKVEETKEHDNKEEEKEIKKEGNVYSTLTAPTEDVYNVSKPTSTPKGSEAEKEEAKAKGDEKAEETNVLSKLNDPPENVDKLTKPTSSPKSNEEAEKKAGGKEKDIKEEETNVYTKLKTPTEDVYNVAKPSSSGSGAEKKAEAKEKDIKEEETDVYSKLITPTEDVYNVSKPSSSSKGEENVKEDEETDLYCKLNTPSENVYMSAVTSSRAKDKEDVNRKLQLYKRISVLFMVLTLILLAVVLALAMKLKERKSIPECTKADPPAEEKKASYPVSQGNQCSECAEDWHKTNAFCIYFGKKRLTWHESREACQNHSADLVVIENERLQKFLSKTTGLLYWIGLHYSENKWMWVNNTALTSNYWSNGPRNPVLPGSCALLKAEGSNNRNWHVNPCNRSSYYICQKRLKVDG